MNFKIMAISALANIILGSNLFTRIKGVVERQEEKFLSGAEKRNAVLNEIEVIGFEAAKWVINLGIELAVAWLRIQSKGVK